jgi:hypothetical protein
VEFMRKLITAAAAALLFAAVSHGAALSFFNTTTPVDYVLGAAGPGLAQVGWAVGAYIESGATSGFTWGEDTLYDSVTIFDGDAGTAGTQGVYFYGGVADTLAEGNILYVVAFNQATIPTVGSTFWYSECVGGPYTMGDQPRESHDFGGDGSWVFVPEPGTLALFALGLVTVAAGRRFRK